MEFLLLLIADMFGGKPAEEPSKVIETFESEKSPVQNNEEVTSTEESLQEAPNIFNVIHFR